MNGLPRMPSWDFQSAIPGVAWPAISDAGGAAVMALLFQLDRSQWLPPERLIELQHRQLDGLLKHAFASVPYYRASWGAPPRPAGFAQLPLLTRRDLQDHFEALKSERLPVGHGPVGETRTSGATGTPVRVRKTQLTNLHWNALTLRDHVWHGRDPRRKLATIRQGATAGEAASWGAATEGLIATGPSAVQTPASSIDENLEWLVQQAPAYLLTYPSLVADLARASLARGIRLAGLLEVRTLGEQLDPETRDLCRDAWGVPLSDMYSAQEVGYIAFQCPGHEHFHVQSESVLLEVLDHEGRACGPGEIGRVVVTDLHNFAMPLLRYEIGDFAEVEEPCPCGRGLPVLRRVVGRTRNMLVQADGTRHWPTFGMRTAIDFAPVIQHQFVQKSYDLIEARLVTAAPLASQQEEKLRSLILSRLPRGFRVQFAYCDYIARSAGGKFEDFYSEVSTALR